LIKAQIGGKVKTKAEAIKFVKEFKSKWKHSKIFVSLPYLQLSKKIMLLL
jgi:hypothetical protein